MQVEVTAAINLVAGSLYNKLPRRRVDAFAEELEKGITKKFQCHWYPENPSKGAAYRCLNVSGEKMDPVVMYAIMTSGLIIDEVNTYLPKELTIWIDPGEVSFSIGEKGQVKLLYSERRSAPNSSEDTTPSVSPPNTFSCSAVATTSSAAVSPVSFTDELPSSLVSSFGGLNLSSTNASNSMLSNGSWGINPNPSPWPNTSTTANKSPWSGNTGQQKAVSPWNQQSATGFSSLNTQQQPAFPIGAPTARGSNNNNKTMTAAMFAQTKFGSTKLKTQAKRSNRLSPTENFQRSTPGQFAAINQKGMNSGSNMSQSLMDRMQVHLQQSHMSELPAEPYKEMALQPYNRGSGDKSGMNTHPFNANGSGGGRFAPFTLGSLTGLTTAADQEWVDLSDLAVYPSGNHLLAT